MCSNNNGMFLWRLLMSTKDKHMNTTIYTDGHGTKVTTQEFVTRDAIYLIRGIIDARMNQVTMSIIPAVFCIAAGLFAIVIGAMHLLQGQPDDNFHLGSLVLTPNRIAALLGFLFVFSGIVALLTRHKKYTVHIVTAEGERDTLISAQKVYVRRVVLAIRRALKLHGPVVARYWK
jgi:hypothetical protein